MCEYNASVILRREVGMEFPKKLVPGYFSVAQEPNGVIL
jgi:hypothetical protein